MSRRCRVVGRGDNKADLRKEIGFECVQGSLGQAP